MGFTEGYKNTSSKKTAGENLIYSQSLVKIILINNSETNFTFQTQNVLNDKYLKLTKLKLI